MKRLLTLATVAAAVLAANAAKTTDPLAELRTAAEAANARFERAAITERPAGITTTNTYERTARWSLAERMAVWAENSRTNIALRIESERLRDIAEKAAAAAEVLRAAAEERAEKAEARTAALREYLVTKRDEAKLATTKAIYQAIIDKLDELLAKVAAATEAE